MTAPVEDPRYPEASWAAGDFGATRRRPRPALPWPLAPELREIHLLCPRPIHHCLEYGELFRVVEAVRAGAPAVEVHVWLRSEMQDASPYRRLPAHGLQPLASAEADRARVLARVAGEGKACVLLGRSRSWSFALREAPGVRLLGSAPLGWRVPSAESPEAQGAGRAFQRALQNESPRWVAGAGRAAPLDPAPRFLVHQARFHAGDVLWLTPLLRAIGRFFPASQTTVVGPPVAGALLAGNPHVADVLLYEPAEGAGARRGILRRLAGTRFDVALLAFARRPESRWLAEAMAGAGVPRRINLEYFDPALDHRRIPSWLTEEGWFFWGALPSPRMLLHALDPLRGAHDWTEDDRRTEVHLSRAARARAHEVLAGAGIGEERFAVLAPGGRSSRRWPGRRFAAIGARLARELGLHVLVEGSPAEARLLDEVAGHARAGLPRRIFPSADPIDVFAALLERATLLVANDSAPIHLAEAVRTPALYFAQREKLVHSHPAPPRSLALFDGVANDLGSIPVTNAWAALRKMVRF